MALQDILNIAAPQKKIGISAERVEQIKPVLRQYIAFWREYPDLFVDFMIAGDDPNHEKKHAFSLYFYQRVLLRVAMRYKYVYGVFPRAFSKSFLIDLIQMIRCVLYPGADIFVAAGGKEQSATILSEKVDDICTKIPAFKREINWSRGEGTTTSRDHALYKFKNDSTLGNLAAAEKSRGVRKHAGVLEECNSMDQKILQDVLIPTMNVSRRALDGTVQEDEVLNQSQIFITTAGYKQTYSYQKLLQILVQMITEPGKAFALGGTYRIPLTSGLLSQSFVADLKRDSTFDEASFDREYNSKWSGTVSDAFFSGDAFDRNRVLQKPEYEFSGRSSASGFYILSVDVARTKGCDTVISVIKSTPSQQGDPYKNLVNLYVMNNEHMEDQAIEIKKLFYKYKARRVVIDANGLGVGLMDFMTRTQIDENGDVYPDFGVYGGNFANAGQDYKKERTNNCEQDAIYMIKANDRFNSDAHVNFQQAVTSGRLRMLIDERTAKSKLLNTKVGAAMSPEKRDQYVRPFFLTSLLKEEIMNLRVETEGVNVRLKGASRNIGHDKFSAVEYGLWYLKNEEESKKKKKFCAKDWLFLN